MVAAFAMWALFAFLAKRADELDTALPGNMASQRHDAARAASLGC